MPIIPSNWTGLQQVNAIASGGGGGSPQFKYSSNFTVNVINDGRINIVGYVDDLINREIKIKVLSGDVNLFWINKDATETLITDNLTTGYTYFDISLNNLGLSVQGTGSINVVLRWDIDTDFYIYSGDELMINPKIRLLLPTGINYPVNDNASAYDVSVSDTYIQNLVKLKNSDSGITGFKIFDIFCFYPGKEITFTVNVDDPVNSNYGNIAVQLFDPMDLAQGLLDIASDMINPETNNLSDSFMGNLTRQAKYSNVSSNQVILYPDFSRHVGRFVAQNLSNNNAYDTVIIENYIPNTDPQKGGTFILTGGF